MSRRRRCSPSSRQHSRRPMRFRSSRSGSPRAPRACGTPRARRARRGSRPGARRSRRRRRIGTMSISAATSVDGRVRVRRPRVASGNRQREHGLADGAYRRGFVFRGRLARVAAAVALAVETFAVASRKAFTVASPTGDLPPSPVPSPYPALGRKYPPADDLSPPWPVSPPSPRRDIAPHGGARFERRRDRNHDLKLQAESETLDREKKRVPMNDVECARTSRCAPSARSRAGSSPRVRSPRASLARARAMFRKRKLPFAVSDSSRSIAALRAIETEREARACSRTPSPPRSPARPRSRACGREAARAITAASPSAPGSSTTP